MRTRGLTLIELMVVLAVTVMLVSSVAFAFTAGVRYQDRVPAQEAELHKVTMLEERLRQLIEGAFLTEDETDPSTYFITLSTSGDLSVPDTLVFTTLGLSTTSAYLTSTEEFEALNERFGPQGGVAEVGLSMVPVGSPPEQSSTTLYRRAQRPPDGDPTQGGLERVMMADAESWTFEFFDGLDWVATWDTQSGQRRLPASVRVTYRMVGDEDDRVLTVRVPLSDVTPENPLTQEVGG